jgi:hypothetical protein
LFSYYGLFYSALIIIHTQLTVDQRDGLLKLQMGMPDKVAAGTEKDEIPSPKIGSRVVSKLSV